MEGEKNENHHICKQNCNFRVIQSIKKENRLQKPVLKLQYCTCVATVPFEESQLNLSDKTLQSWPGKRSPCFPEGFCLAPSEG